jgi:DNA-directed RNA polymerase subunit RPC12/RpoP
MFEIICCECGNSGELKYSKKHRSIERPWDMRVAALDGSLIIECENCGHRIDEYNHDNR